MAGPNRISISLEAESARFSQGTQQVVKDLNKLGAEIEHIKKQGGSDVFDKLREGLGKKSALGETFELLRGGGPIKGLSLAAESIKGAAEEASKLKEELNAGKISAGELAEKLAGQLPVIGQFWQAGRAIRDLITDEAADNAKILASGKALDEVLKSQKASMERMAKDADEYAKALAEAERIKFMSQHPGVTDTDKDAIRHYNEKYEAEQKLAALENEKAEKLKKLDDNHNLTELRKQAAEAAEEARTSPDSTFGTYAHDAETAQEAQRRAQILRAAVNARETEKAEIEKNFEERKKLIEDNVKNQGKTGDDAATRERTERDKANARKDAKEIADAQTEAQVQAIRNADGMDAAYQVQLVELKKHLQDRLAEIKRQAEEEAKVRPENKKAIDEVAHEKILAETALNASQVKAAAIEEERRKTEQLSKAQDAMAESEKQHWDEVNKLREESLSPLDKYKEKVAEIERLRQDAGDEVANRALDKANKDLLSGSHAHNEGIDVKNESRRFDFTIGKDIKTDPIADLAAQEKEAQKSRERANQFLENIDRYERNRDRTQNQPVNL